MDACPKSCPESFGSHYPRVVFLARKSGLVLGVHPEQGVFILAGGKCAAAVVSPCLREWIWEIQTFPVEIPSARADFPWLQEEGVGCHQGQSQIFSSCSSWSPCLWQPWQDRAELPVPLLCILHLWGELGGSWGEASHPGDAEAGQLVEGGTACPLLLVAPAAPHACPSATPCRDSDARSLSGPFEPTGFAFPTPCPPSFL